MKIVFIPGMDGSGELFNSVLANFPYDTSVIPLPQSGAQDYRSISDQLIRELPKDDFVLVLESFAGGLAKRLITACEPRLRGVIFVASFMSSPNRALLFIAKLMPLKKLLKIKSLRFALRLLMFGNHCPESVIEAFIKVVNDIPESLIRKRLKAMADLNLDSEFQSQLPCVYLQPNQDRLVSKSKAAEIKQCLPNLKLIKLAGPHFILQNQPTKCASILAETVSQWQS